MTSLLFRPALPRSAAAYGPANEKTPEQHGWQQDCGGRTRTSVLFPSSYGVLDVGFHLLTMEWCFLSISVYQRPCVGLTAPCLAAHLYLDREHKPS